MEPLKIPGNLNSLTEIKEYVRTAAKKAKLNGKACYKLVLAVDEIATNAINYGYADCIGDLYLYVYINQKSLIIIMEDSGVRFDPFKLDIPDFNQPLEERKIGGIGVYLAIHSVDKFIYKWVEKLNCNRNIFIMCRNQYNCSTIP